MKRVLVLLLGAMLVASLSLVVSCQKREEPAQTGERTSSSSEQAVGTAEKAMKQAADSGEKVMKEAADKAAGYGK
jgi:hypothetical protein